MLVVTLDFLYDDFEIITTFLLHSSNKDLKEIQQIVTSSKVVNVVK